jgi:cysteine desulfurase
MSIQPVTDSAPELIYLDNNASTHLCDEAFAAMLPWLQQNWGNPSSAHSWGKDAAEAVARARNRLAAILNVRPNQVIFTSGATESTALAILGARREHQSPRRLLTAHTEHRSVLAAVEKAAEDGMDVRYVPPGPTGRVDPSCLADHDIGPGDLVSLQWLNNETGVINDVASIVAFVHARGGLMHVDAAQALGKVDIDLAALGADYVTLSAHKAHGPKGVGALVLGPDAELAPLWVGGAQEGSHRGGTENVAGVVGFAMAAEVVTAGGETERAAIRRLRDRFEAELTRRTKRCVVIGAEAPRAPNTAMLSWPGLNGRVILQKLDAWGLAASSSSACSSAKEADSHVLKEIGASADIVRGAVRFSLSRETTEAEIDRAIDLITDAVRNLRRTSVAAEPGCVRD